MLGNFTAFIAVNNTLVVVSAGCAHAASSWPCDSLPMSLDIYTYFVGLAGDVLNTAYNTINDKSLEWLQFGEFGKLMKFAKLSFTNLLQDHGTFY